MAASLALAAAAVSASCSTAQAHASLHAGIGYDYGGYLNGTYPNNYYPNYYYPYEYYTPHVPHDYPFYYPLFNDHPNYLVCTTIISTKVYWRNHKKYSVQVPLRSCYRAHGY